MFIDIEEYIVLFQMEVCDWVIGFNFETLQNVAPNIVILHVCQFIVQWPQTLNEGNQDFWNTCTVEGASYVSAKLIKEY